MVFEAIFVGIFVVAWLICGFLPWLILSVVTRGNAGLINLPLSLFTAVVAGVAVPVFGANGVGGIWLSLVLAVTAPSFLLWVRRLSLHHTVPGNGTSQEK